MPKSPKHIDQGRSRPRISLLAFRLCLALFAPLVFLNTQTVLARQSNPLNSQSLPNDLTALTRETAEELFNEMARNQEIPFTYPDGCYAKAQKISILLEERGVISGKAFIEGNIFHFDPAWGELFWTFHVAPLILIHEDDSLKPYVIDPFLTHKLVNLETWSALVTKDRRTRVKKQYFTNRFVYDPSQVALNPNEYNPKLVRDMEIVFKQIRKRLEARKPKLAGTP